MVSVEIPNQNLNLSNQMFTVHMINSTVFFDP